MQIALDRLDLPPLDLGQPTADQIAAALRQAILHLDLPPGSALSETEIARGFGASRTPVRAALADLRREGLIVTLPSRGTFVTRLSEPAIRAAQFVREALERAAAARICADGLPEDARAALERALAAQEAALAAQDPGAFHRADDAFHAALAAATGLDGIDRLVAREKSVLDRLRALRLGDAAHRAALAEDHVRLFKALRKGRAARADEILTAHLRGVLAVLDDLKADHGAYFE